MEETIDNNRCPMCKSVTSTRKCSLFHKFCEKFQRYTEDRETMIVYDPVNKAVELGTVWCDYYRLFLPVNVKSMHYEDVNERRLHIRSFDMKKYHSAVLAYREYLLLVWKFYPSLMTDTQKDHHFIQYPDIINYDMLKPVSYTHLKLPTKRIV